MAKNGSFGFARNTVKTFAKPNVPFMLLAKRNLNNAKV